MASPPPIEPSEFDLVVLGTGLVESLVAAAAAKAGRPVLQLDPAGFYGGAWASLQLSDLLAALQACSSSSGGGEEVWQEGNHEGGSTAEGGSGCGCGDSEGEARGGSAGIKGLAASLSGAAVLTAPGAELGPSGQYSLDLAPKVLYGAGPLIELLLGSGAHNYTEFKLVQGSYLWQPGGLRPVPASRSEVFKDRSLGLAQKRAFMKFLKGCAEALEGAGPLQGCFDSRLFSELMRSQGLEPELQKLLLHAVLLLDHAQQAQQGGAGRANAAAAAALPIREGSSAGMPAAAAAATDAAEPVNLPSAAGASSEGEQQREGAGAGQQQQAGPITAAAALDLLRVYMQSVGRYGQDTGPFLTPMYGCGELPQAFCRVAAVAGAVQVLRCPVEGPLFDEHTFSCIGVELGSGQVIRCQQLAAGGEFLQEWLATFHPGTCHSATHRCVAILDRPLVPGEHQSLLVAPPGALRGAVHAVRGVALSTGTRVCPEGRFVLHLWTPAPPGGSRSALDTLRPALESLVDASGLLPLDKAQQAQRAEGAPPHPGAAPQAPAAAAAAVGTGPPGSEGLGAQQEGSPRALLAAFFTQQRVAIEQYPGAWPANTVLCPGPDHTATFRSAVADARACFSRLYPDEQRFPLEPQPRDEDADSDEEALEALNAALGRLPGAAVGNSGGGAAAAEGGTAAEGGEAGEPGGAPAP